MGRPEHRLPDQLLDAALLQRDRSPGLDADPGLDRSALVLIPSSWADVRAVFFDLNGTLIDDVPRALRATNIALAQHGLEPIDEAAFRAAFVLPLTDFVARLGIEASAATSTVNAWNAAMASESAPLMPGALELLSWLSERGIRTGVVSAAGCETVRPDLDAHGLTPVLSEIHCGVSDKPAVLAAEVERSGCVLYVGDTEYDLESARSAGALGVAITCGYRSAEDLARVDPWGSVSRLSDLQDLLEL